MYENLEGKEGKGRGRTFPPEGGSGLAKIRAGSFRKQKKQESKRKKAKKSGLKIGKLFWNFGNFFPFFVSGKDRKTDRQRKRKDRQPPLHSPLNKKELKRRRN